MYRKIFSNDCKIWLKDKNFEKSSIFHFAILFLIREKPKKKLREILSCVILHRYVYLLKESESARKFKRTLSRRHQNLLCGKTISNGKFCSGKYRRSCVFCLARKPLHQMKNEWSQLMIVVILQTIILQIVQEDYIFFRAKTIKTLYNEYIGRQCVYLREECIQWCLPWTDYQMIDIGNFRHVQ